MELKQSPLHDRHLALGAKMVPFAGYEMPVQYSGISAEHLAVREQAGLFDVSHMGEFIVSGDSALDFLQLVTINDVSKLKIGQAQYSAMCLEDGGIIDDILIYRYTNHFMLIVNASNMEKDYSWLESHLRSGVKLENKSDNIALIALQGPKSRDILKAIGFESVNQIGFYHFIEAKFNNQILTMARTGYTGELGYEIYGDGETITTLWDAIIEGGRPYGLIPVGLGARDTLRLEMKYCLYGNDIDEKTHPYESGLGWITKVEKGDFIGKKAILARKENLNRRLVCIEMTERAVPRHGYPVFSGNEQVGIVTSGTQSPSLQKGIGLAYINLPHAKPGSEVEVNIRGRRKSALVVKPPFYKHGTIQD